MAPPDDFRLKADLSFEGKLLEPDGDLRKLVGVRHFKTLDGVRGAAAIAVLFYHFRGMLGRLGSEHGYLAVDLFFMLSGFVLGHAYEGRLRHRRITLRKFVWIRLARLYPLYALGTLVGALVGVAAAAQHGTLGADHLIFIVAGAALLANPLLTGALFPFNEPAWSLWFELLINFLWAAGIKVLNTPALIAASGLGLVTMLTLGARVGDLNGGAEWSTLGLGAARVMFAFPAGLLLYRVAPRQQVETNWSWLVLLSTIAVLFAPFPRSTTIDILLVVLFFPVIILAGAVLEPTRGRAFLWLGLVSYPLYVLQTPIGTAIQRADNLLKFSVPPTVLAVWLVASILIAAWLAELWFDKPLRRWLRSRQLATTQS